MLALLFVLLLPADADAQRAGMVADGVQWELRGDVRWSGLPDAQALIGGAVPLDRAIRLAFLAGGGVERGAGRSDAAVMGEVHARVLLDPLASRLVGWYGAVGLGVRGAESRAPRPYLLALAGVEGPRMLGGRFRLAVEGGVGDGVRLGIALRTARPGAR